MHRLRQAAAAAPVPAPAPAPAVGSVREFSGRVVDGAALESYGGGASILGAEGEGGDGCCCCLLSPGAISQRLPPDNSALFKNTSYSFLLHFLKRANLSKKRFCVGSKKKGDLPDPRTVSVREILKSQG